VYSFFIPSLWKCRNLDQELAAVAEGRRRRNRNTKNRKKRNGFCVIFNSEVLPGLGDKGFWFCQGWQLVRSSFSRFLWNYYVVFHI
jgi:hypothetical protein